MYESIPGQWAKDLNLTYGELYARMKDHVASMLNLGINEQIRAAQEGCYYASLMISQLVYHREKSHLLVPSQAMLVAYGGYTEQEGKKGNQWREETIETLYRHLDHEIDEVRRSKSKTVRLHNAMDACNLFAMLAVKYMGD